MIKIDRETLEEHISDRALLNETMALVKEALEAREEKKKANLDDLKYTALESLLRISDYDLLSKAYKEEVDLSEALNNNEDYLYQISDRHAPVSYYEQRLYAFHNSELLEELTCLDNRQNMYTIIHHNICHILEQHLSDSVDKLEEAGINELLKELSSLEDDLRTLEGAEQRCGYSNNIIQSVKDEFETLYSEYEESFEEDIRPLIFEFVLSICTNTVYNLGRENKGESCEE